MKEDTIPETIDQIEDLELEREIECIDFEIGDHVVYPHHGAGQVLKKEDKEILGEVRQYLTIKILHNDMTVMVPCANAGKAGLRRIIDAETVEKTPTRPATDPMPRHSTCPLLRALSGHQHGRGSAMLRGSDRSDRHRVPGGVYAVLSINDDAFLAAADVTVNMHMEAVALLLEPSQTRAKDCP